MPQIPQDRSLDSTLALAFNGYKFISQRCQRYQSDIFQTRLLFQKTICFKGEEAAQVFYDPEKFRRKNAAPKRLKKTLFGESGVQGMDGSAHRHRKQMFMSLMTDEGIQRLADLTREQWLVSAQKWSQSDKIVLFEEAQAVFCRASCAWTGVPLSESEVKQRTADLEAMIDASGAVGPKHWRGRQGRQRTEKWIKDIIEQVRNNKLAIPEDSAAYAIAMHRDLDGKLLNKYTAAVELINILRPTVAIARYVTFAALALHQHPECRQKLQKWNGSQFNLIPQGGGDYYTNHRCPGEWSTIELMKVTLNFLTQSLQYDVPEQNLEISLSKMPTTPKSGFVMSKVKFA